MKQIAKAYNHLEFEEDIYQNWEKSGYFKPEINPDGEPFCIIMPPPNANGSLHVGHALFVTLEDIMTRYARLQGKAALWLPGADHAGFETQAVFEKKLEKEGKSRFQYEREELNTMIWDFTQENKTYMENQLRRLGSSCDWDRAKFTLDKDIQQTVYETFVKMYDDGLIYRANRLVNWCTKHQTSLSDLEVNFIDRDDFIYEIQYGPIVVATTRPETMFGDTAVAVHPEDKRYKTLLGTEIDLPLTNRKIKIVADDAIDIKFGTGAVKITPAHDPLDFEIGQRHKLDTIQVIDNRGKMVIEPLAGINSDIAALIEGKKAKEARDIIVLELEKAGYLVSTKPHAHSVGTCYKCNTIIEPLLSEQWYVAVNKKGEKSGKIFAKDALEAVKSGRVEFVSERFKKSCIQWLENIRDWNISRQIVWGIQIPVWTRGEETFAGTEAPEGEGWTQETDVFDTWFSSGQWPFATLKNSKTPGDFDKFYPTSVMETGYDIIFFWVIRMIMFGLYINDEVPFKNVYMHGIVRDKNNQKMSKSKGNVVNPLELANLYGTDAVRTALVFGTSAGADSCISEEKIKGYRNFSNKIWNASRFVMLQVTNGDLKTGDIGETKLDNLDIDETILTNADKAILKDLADVKTSVTKKMTEYRFSQAGEELYEYFWHTFCDIYIEAAKGQLGAAPLSVIPSEAGIQADELVAINTKKILIKVLTETLIMLHPFIPFVTEAVWQELLNIFPQLPKSIMIAKWPE